MRGRFKTTRVCSSDNYTLSKKLHMSMLEENHEVFMKMVTRWLSLQVKWQNLKRR